MSHKTWEPHEITKTDSKMKFFYFLRDLGIKSAQEPAQITWKRHIEILTHLYNGAWHEVS